MPRKLPRDKPIAALRTFARRLGWSQLRCYQHLWEERNLLITRYESGNNDGSRSDLFLQINESPLGQTATYTTAVYAIRYQICTGWHSMKLGPDAQPLDSEIERLDSWLHRRWFESLANRRKYRRMHPECTGWSWKRIRHERCVTTACAQAADRDGIRMEGHLAAAG
jgi:hypothetical protein